MTTEFVTTTEYVGLWITPDSEVRQALLPNGRYVKARGHDGAAHQGDYWVEGTHIEYRDDSGNAYRGDFIDGVLHLGGKLMYARD